VAKEKGVGTNQMTKFEKTCGDINQHHHRQQRFSELSTLNLLEHVMHDGGDIGLQK
jgi:hypothetical protein